MQCKRGVTILEENMEIGMLLWMLNNRLSARCNKELEEIELTVSQSEIIAYLIHNEGREVNQRDIELAFKLMNPTVTGILNRLEKKGFVVRKKSKVDGRYKKVELTESGRELRDKMLEKVTESKKCLFKGLSEAQLNDFGNTLRILIDNISE